MPRPHAAGREEKKKILVYLFGSLGDSIVAIPALRAVRRHFRDSEIVMLQNFDSDALVSASHVIPDGLVDRFLSYKSSSTRSEKPSEFFRLWRTLRRERFAAAAYLVTSERPANAVRRDRFFFRSCGINDLYGFHAIPPDELYPVDPDGLPARSEHEAVFKLRRLSLDGIEWSPESDLRVPLIDPAPADVDEIDKWLGRRRRKPNVPLISIGPGCKQQVNVWPLANFARLGERLTAEVPCELIVVGGKSEFDMGEELISGWRGGINAAGLFSVRQSAALLSRCDFHIGLDTGTTHLAAAAGARCFGIFGERNNPGLWYPLGGGHTVVHHGVPCGPCRASTCAVPGHPCMTDISFETVWEQLRQFLNSASESSAAEVKVIAA